MPVLRTIFWLSDARMPSSCSSLLLVTMLPSSLRQMRMHHALSWHAAMSSSSSLSSHGHCIVPVWRPVQHRPCHLRVCDFDRAWPSTYSVPNHTCTHCERAGPLLCCPPWLAGEAHTCCDLESCGTCCKLLRVPEFVSARLGVLSSGILGKEHGGLAKTNHHLSPFLRCTPFTGCPSASP